MTQSNNTTTETKNYWHRIPDFEGIYGINTGLEIKNLITGKILKPSINGVGYYHVGLIKEGKTYFRMVHRIIAAVFIPNIENKPYVNHKDGNRLNNAIENLEWCTQKENIHHSIYTTNTHVIPDNAKRSIKILEFDNDGFCIATYPSLNACSKHKNIDRQVIKRALSGTFNRKYNLNLKTA